MATANTLTILIPAVIAAVTRVTRNTGAVLNAVTLDASAAAVAKDQTVRMPGSASLTASSITPSMTVSDASGITPESETLTLDQLKGAEFDLTTEEENAIANNASDFRGEQIGEAVAACINAVCDYTLGFLGDAAGYAVGTAGTTPFASDLDLFADVDQVLNEQKALGMDRYLIGNPGARSNALKLDIIQKSDQAPEGTNFARGIMRDYVGMMFGMDQQVPSHTKGTGSSYQTSSAVTAGNTTVPLDTGSGTVLAGDVVTFADDTDNKYVVKTGITEAGSIVLNSPLLEDISDDNAMTILANHRENIALQRSAAVLAIRPPIGGDAAIDEQIIRDPISGLALRLAKYGGHHANKYEVSVVYGGGVRRRNHIVKVLG
jgi:hypothetical protein